MSSIRKIGLGGVIAAKANMQINAIYASLTFMSLLVLIFSLIQNRLLDILFSVVKYFVCQTNTLFCHAE
jgi:hypothetical protein